MGDLRRLMEASESLSSAEYDVTNHYDAMGGLMAIDHIKRAQLLVQREIKRIS